MSASTSRYLGFAATKGPSATSSSFSSSASPFPPRLFSFGGDRVRQVCVCHPISNVPQRIKLLDTCRAVGRLPLCVIVQEVSPSFDRLVGKNLYVRKIRDGVCATCEAVRARGRIADIVGRIRVVGKLAFDGEGRTHALLPNAPFGRDALLLGEGAIGGRHEHVLVVRRYLNQHNTACLLSGVRARALPTLELPSLASVQERGLWSSAGTEFKVTDPGDD
ncbi:hypothetical protein PSPO01_15654 [Paraphaeosphaeria sporulosa]